MPDPRSTSVGLPGGPRLHVWDTPDEARLGEGEAPVLVGLHAFGLSGRSWTPVADALGGALRVVAPDLPGWGLSDPAASYTVADVADAVEALVASLGLDHWAILGHSMGGKAALALAARRPPGLTHLVLVAPSPPTPEPMSDADRTRLHEAWGDRAAVARVVAGASARSPVPDRPEPSARFEEAVEDHLRASHAAWTAWLDEGSREDISDLAGQVAVPTLVVAGAEDDALGEAVQRRETVARIPGARLEVVPGAAHFVPLDAPEMLAALIRAHVLGT